MTHTCPHCGAPLPASDALKVQCEYCGCIVALDEQALLDAANTARAEEMGYRFEKGRQRAIEEQSGPEREQPKKRHTGLWVLGWVFLFPVPVTILTLRSKLHAAWKALIILAAWGAYVALALYGKSA